MDPPARRALRIIQACLHAGRYRVLAHFVHRMDLRGLFWADIQAVIDSPQDGVDDGLDRFGRPKWRIRGRTTDHLDMEILCVLDHDEEGNLTVFVTAYWN